MESSVVMKVREKQIAALEKIIEVYTRYINREITDTDIEYLQKCHLCDAVRGHGFCYACVWRHLVPVGNVGTPCNIYKLGKLHGASLSATNIRVLLSCNLPIRSGVITKLVKNRIALAKEQILILQQELNDEGSAV